MSCLDKKQPLRFRLTQLERLLSRLKPETRILMKIELTTNPTQSDIDEIRSGLRNYNTPYLENVFHSDVVCFTKDINGAKTGGLVGEIWGNWLVIKYLWVSPENKGQGLGSQLLLEAENFAKTKGCHSCFLDTFSFQAKPFYIKRGYQLQFTLEQFPENSERHYFTKHL